MLEDQHRVKFTEEPVPPSWIETAPVQEYCPLATSDDILSCFRLLLGRYPDPGEWLGHALQAGHDLESVVASYLNSLEFSRRGLNRNSKNSTLEIAKREGFRIYADPKDPIIGAAVIKGNYEPEIVTLFEQSLRPGMGVLDIGANIGYFSMLAASLVGPAGFVLAVEPNPINVRMLEASRKLNAFGHITILQAAASSGVGLLAFHATHSTGVTSPISLDHQNSSDEQLVPCLPIDRILSEDRKIDLIKIDVDGSEYHALTGVKDLIKRDRPVIITEFCPGGLLGLSGIDGYAYLLWLAELGYRLSIVEADGSTSAVDNPDQVARVLEGRGGDHLDLICNPIPPELGVGSAGSLFQGLSSQDSLADHAVNRSEQRSREFERELTLTRDHLKAANLHARDAESRARGALKERVVAAMRSAELESAISEMQRALEAANVRERHASMLLAACQTSTSWQLTAPMRSGTRFLRRLRGKIQQAR